MKQLFTSILFIVLLSLAFNSKAQDVKTKSRETAAKEARMNKEKDRMKVQDGSRNEAVAYPYTASYSSRFEIGNAAHAKMVLDLFKGYENNDFSAEDQFSDTVMALLADGTQMRGRDNVIGAFKKQRGGLSSSQFNFEAVIPLKSVDRDEDWVALWGSQNATSTDGKQSTTWFQQIWRINKAGKIDYMQFYEAKPPQQQ